MYNYYQLTTKETINKLKTNPKKGLSQQKVEKRLEEYGFNQLEKKERIHPIKIFLKQFKDPIIMILLGAIIISLAVGAFIDALVIAIILVLNAVIGFSQEYKAEKSIELLKKMSSLHAKVRRDGKEQSIEAKFLVPGDIIILEAGDKVPADARILKPIEIHVNESMLTGESLPVKKSLTTIEKETPLAERKNMLFSGTILTNGRAEAVVTETGMNTQLGKIAELVQTVEEVQTPLQKRLAKLGKKIGIITILVCLLVLGIGFLKQLPFVQILLTAISLAVSAIPEGLPAVVTIALAIGVQRMLKKKALIRDLKAVETLGAVTVICSDKTGTITKNEMTVTEIFANNETITLTGKGYELQGEFFIGKKKISPERIHMLLKSAASCNNATLDFGDPTEIALLVAAKKAGIEKETRTGEIPFDSVKKYMITQHSHDLWHIKGAPEKIIELCSHIHINNTVKRLTKKDKELILTKNKEMASRALRVLAMAYKKGNKTILTGLAGMIDPPRKEVFDAIKLSEKAGIRIVMITGDNAITAEAVANKIGLKGKVMEGFDLDRITDEKLKKLVKEVTIFARVDPKHKVKILKALQSNGEIVAMTGDGVNDAPALKGADIGISMAVKGTDVAKEASDMILTDDNFASIVAAVKEGRIIYDNIKKFVKFLLSVNFSEVGLILFSILAGMPLPLLPLQILWINLVTDSLPALALGVDTPDPKVMERKPRNPKETILKGSIWFLIIAGFLAFLTSLIAFFIGMPFDIANGVDLLDFNSPSKARTMVLTTSILFQMLFVFSCRTDKQSVFKIGIFSNKWLVGAVSISI
ncbi:MAG: cation-translocating P-type ATPase, partial [Nanoarchaeota archaeon]|nr:cation-translocating P-type ATPase [Nanoarchaeota archaeon]